MRTEDMYYRERKRDEVQENARILRRKFLRYQQAEIVCSEYSGQIYTISPGLGNRDSGETGTINPVVEVRTYSWTVRRTGHNRGTLDPE